MSDPKMTPTEALALVARLRAKQRLGQSLSRKETWQLLDAIEALARALAEAEKSLERSKRLRDQYRQAVETERNHSNPARALAQLEGQA